MLSGKIVIKINFEISHFVRDDNQFVRYLGGVGWRLRCQPTPPKTTALKTPSFRPQGEISNINRTLLKDKKRLKT
jgi:hypothetical protein